MLKRKEIRKKIKVALVVLFFCIASVLVYSFFSKADNYKVLVLSTDEYLLYREFTNQWFSMTQKEFLDKGYNKDSHTLFVGSTNKGTFKYKMIDNTLEIVNVSNNVVMRYKNKKWFSYGGSSRTRHIDYTASKFNEDDEKIIFKLLKQNKLGSDYNASYSEKYSIDFDGDTKKEKLYIISNLVDFNKLNINKESDKIFSFMFLVDDGKIMPIYSKIVNSDNINNLCLPSFEGALTIGTKQRMVISYCEYFGEDSYKLNLYNYKDSKFHNISIN